MHRRFKPAIITVSLLLSSCTNIPSPDARRLVADRLAAEQGWHAELLSAGRFSLMSYSPRQATTAPLLTVYIEGDGFAWQSRSSPSSDPTPLTPTGLMMALKHPDDNTAYLARPGQYVGSQQARETEQVYWTNMRFSPEVIDASNRALDLLKQKRGARQLQLIGYSGGGAVATLLAARRDDVVHLITVAGNLDHASWTKTKRLAPLTGSLNPADNWRALTTVSQVHFVGGKDRVTGALVAEAYRDRFPADSRPSLVHLPEFDHHCCWAQQWQALYPLENLRLALPD